MVPVFQSNNSSPPHGFVDNEPTLSKGVPHQSDEFYVSHFDEHFDEKTVFILLCFRSLCKEYSTIF